MRLRRRAIPLFSRTSNLPPRHARHPFAHPSGLSNPISYTSTPELSRTTAKTVPPPALSCLPLTKVFRTYVITSISSSPTLWRMTFAILRRMASSSSFLTDPERNLLLRWVLKKTFYAQFCAGENIEEAHANAQAIRDIGFSGVILESALEVVGESDSTASESKTRQEIELWKTNMLDTVRMVQSGEFVALKWSGLGQNAMRLLSQNRPPSALMQSAIHEVCGLAAAKNVAVLPGAEEDATNPGIDTWTLALMRRYNSAKGGRAIMYNTYQAYLKTTPVRLAKHLAAAEKEGYTLGVKLVRGAYLASETKALLLPNKAETDRVYNSLAESLLRNRHGDVLQPVHGQDDQKFPSISLVLATHNMESVQRAQKIRDEQAALGKPRIELSYAQLQGMADEVGCELIQMGRSAELALDDRENASLGRNTDSPRVFKCLPWGSTTECLHYLMRRAAENKDAATRTEGTRRAMGAELVRRVRGVRGFV